VKRRTADQLAADYRFLRRVEHRLQMIDDQQTQQLPATDAGIRDLAVFLGFPGQEAFHEALLDTLTRVEEHYAALFEEAPTLSGPGNLVFTGTEDDPETIQTLRGLGFGNPSAVAGQVRAWHHGRYRATRSTRARELLTELIPALLETLGRTPDPDQAFLRFDGFLSRLPAGVQLFSLFYANPKLLELVAEIMGSAPRLAATLANRPAELDAVLTPGFFDGLPPRDELDASYALIMGEAHGFEDELDLTRRWTHEQRFRAGVHILRGITDADRCGPFLSEVADIGLAGLLSAVEREFQQRHGGFPGSGMAIVGMGRLGARSLSLSSDLDLITVYEVPPDAVQSAGPKPLSPNEYFIKLTQRLVNAVTAQTAEGALYEVDMRLRPSGNKGPLAVSFEAFAKYQRENAWTWEHMALTRSRPVAGPPDLCSKLEAEIRTILTAPRDTARLLADVASMRGRMAQNHRADDVWDVKHLRGGMVDIQFTVQYLTLRHAHAAPGIIAPNTTDALARLKAAGLLPAADADTLIEAQRLWRRVQGFLRLTTEGRFDPGIASAGLKAALARATFGSAETGGAPVDFGALEARIRAVAAECHAIYRRIVEQPAADAAKMEPAP
jgi:glutamate-ammonia-ligase adenylyltransferase